MGDRLQHELLAVPGLDSITALQLQDLAWKTREQVLIALFQEHASSSSIAEELRMLSRDRRLERKTEKSENADRDAVHKSEDRFRSEFMQVTAKELSRLGAPTMVTWPKLVFDKDCCAQAFRILLTKIKSSKRSVTSSSHSVASVGSAPGPRRPITLAKRFTSHEPEDEEESHEDGKADADEGSVAESCFDNHHPDLPALSRRGPRSTSKKQPAGGAFRKSVVSLKSSVQWNSDTSVIDSQRGEDTGRAPMETDGGVPFGSSDFIIQRTTPKPTLSVSTSSFANKLKRNQLHSAQQENAALATENTRLLEEITHLEALVETLQGSNNSAPPDSTHHARMKLLQAQNMQLQRQITMLQDAMQEREMAQSILLTSLSHWREIVDSGRQEAKAAGAEDHAKTKDGKPVQWMLAVPERLLDELSRVEAQIHHASRTASVAQEAKLRIGGCAAEFTKLNNTSSVSYSDIYVPGIAHLRVERVKKLEAALVDSVWALEAVHEDLIRWTRPLVGDSVGDTSRSRLDEALSKMRQVIMEVGALGIVVPGVVASAVPVERGEEGELVTVAQVQRAYVAASSATSGVSVKDREKQLKAMLKQLQACEGAMLRDRDRVKKEATYWKNAWAMQEQLLHSLMQRVRSVGDKKMQWIETHVVQPLAELQDVWASFQHAQRHDQRTHKNAYLPLLIDTLQRHEPTLCLDAIAQWQSYATRANDEIDAIVDDYRANCELLKSMLATTTA